MAFYLEEMLPRDQRLRTAKMQDSVRDAIDLMHRHGYNQLPVVKSDEKTALGLVVTFDSIIEAMRSFKAEVGSLLVRDATKTVKLYSPDADLLATLDDIQRDNFAVIVGEDNQLTGIVTTSDATVFFREYAQDLMLIEGIESRIKEAILALYGQNELGLKAAIVSATDRNAEIRKKIPIMIREYIKIMGLQITDDTDSEALIAAERCLGLEKVDRKFESLTFNEFTSILLSHPGAPKLSLSGDVSELRVILNQISRLLKNPL